MYLEEIIPLGSSESLVVISEPSVHSLPTHRVVIRGEQGENAVLCTEGATYELRTADTSNALLLVPSLSYSQDNCKRDTHPINFNQSVSFMYI